MTEIGKKMLAFQEQLARTYRYKPIGFNLFVGDVRQMFLETLPSWCHMDGDRVKLCTDNGTLIAYGYNRVVIGDYGAFLEIETQDMNRNAIRVKPGQEYRLNDERFSSHCKYIWLTAKDRSGVKIYYQLKTVDYADYQPGMCYISPYEVNPIMVEERE